MHTLVYKRQCIGKKKTFLSIIRNLKYNEPVKSGHIL